MYSGQRGHAEQKQRKMEQQATSKQSFLWVREVMGGSESLINKTRQQRIAVPRAGGAFQRVWILSYWQ